MPGRARFPSLVLSERGGCSSAGHKAELVGWRNVAEARDLGGDVNVDGRHQRVQGEILQDGGEVEEELHAGHGFTQADALACKHRADATVRDGVGWGQQGVLPCPRAEPWLPQCVSGDATASTPENRAHKSASHCVRDQPALLLGSEGPAT